MTTTARPAASRPATTSPAATSSASTRPASSANGPRSIQLDQASAKGTTALQLLRQPLAAESTTEPGTATTPTALSTPPAPDPTSPAPAASAGFSSQQNAALAAPLNRALVSSREQGRGQVCYLQSWVVINEANRIFGFDGWQRQTLFCHCVAQAERLIGAKGQGREQKSGWGVTYIARVRITVFAGNQGPLIREGTGAGHGIDTDQGLAHESAIKEAETDAMKRALITFGNPFGLALYDKSQRQVSGAPAPAQGGGAQSPQGRGVQPRHCQQASGSHHPQPNSRQAIQRPQASGSQATQRPASQATARPQAPAQASPQPPATRPAQAANGHQPQPASPDALLDPTTGLQLQEQLKALSPRHRDAFSRAFRAAFQVPDSTPSVAGLIRQERHRIWIQEFLAKASRS